MKARKINDKELLEFLREGKKNQKEIAEHLGVSPVAIHKRIKRLNALQLPKSLENLTEKEKNFAIAVASGQSRTNAVMQSYDVTSRESAKALQQTLMKNPEIRTAIDDLMELKGIGREYRVEKLKQHLENPDPVVSLKSLDMAFKIAGDEEASKRQMQEKPALSFTQIADLTYFRNPASFDKLEGKCSICKVETVENFCNACNKKYPVLIDKIIRHWNGDKCATCLDDRRCYDFCKACKAGLSVAEDYSIFKRMEES